MASLSMGAKEFGVVLSSLGVGFLMAQIPGGLLSDRFGARPMLVIASLLWALLTGFTGLVSTVTALVDRRFPFGFSEGEIKQRRAERSVRKERVSKVRNGGSTK